MKWTRSLIPCLLQLFIQGICLLASPVPWGRELWEGSECELENGRPGQCVKAVNCPKKMEDILKWGNYSDEGRCSFWEFEEIVCCEKRRSEGVRINRVRKAVAACQRYKNEDMKKEEEEAVFSIVVYNGVSAKAGEYPQVVALGYPDQSDDELVVNGIKYICGGTLISERHVLTAAHCVNNVHGFVPTEVVLGTIELTTTKIKPELRVPISKITRHPDYRRSFHYNDVAIIEMKNSVAFSKDVRPACLATEPPRTPSDGSRSPLVILGWGAIDIDGTRSPKLLKADWLNLVEKSKCSQSYKGIEGKIPNGLNEGMVCAADPNTERKSDTCPGDSGGPLFVKGNKFPALVGVTSFGQACSAGAPGVYAAVHRYLDWIENQVWP